MTETPSSGSNVPALEKGIAVLEFLAKQETPVSLQDISAGLHKSRGELYRMIKWLVEREFIIRDDASDTYILGQRLGQFYQGQPAAVNVIEQALPLMTQISEATQATSYLSVLAYPSSVVLAAVRSSQVYDLAIELGTQMSLAECACGACLSEQLTDEDVNTLTASTSKENQERFVKERDDYKETGFVKRLGITGPGIFEMSFDGPRQAQLISAITVAKIMPTREDFDAVAGIIENLMVENEF